MEIPYWLRARNFLVLAARTGRDAGVCAEQLGVSSQFLRQMILGKRPVPEKLRKTIPALFKGAWWGLAYRKDGKVIQFRPGWDDLIAIEKTRAAEYTLPLPPTHRNDGVQEVYAPRRKRPRLNGPRLRTRLQELGRSPRWLAGRVHKTPAYVRMILNGHAVGHNIHHDILRALGVIRQTDDFLIWE